MSTESQHVEKSPPPHVDEADIGEGALLKDIDHSDGVADAIAATVIVVVFVAIAIYWIWSQGQLD